MQTPTAAQMLTGARNQHQVFFMRMATEGMRWNAHQGQFGFVLLREDAVCDVPLPIAVTNVHAMTADTMVSKLHAFLQR